MTGGCAQAFRHTSTPCTSWATSVAVAESGLPPPTLAAAPLLPGPAPRETWCCFPAPMISRIIHTRPVSPHTLVPEYYDGPVSAPPDRTKKLSTATQVGLCVALAALSAAQNLLIEASRTTVAVRSSCSIREVWEAGVWRLVRSRDRLFVRGLVALGCQQFDGVPLHVRACPDGCGKPAHGCRLAHCIRDCLLAMRGCVVVNRATATSRTRT